MKDDIERAIALRQEGSTDAAIELLRHLLVRAPHDPELNYQCAWTCDAAGKEREAVNYYEAALAHGLLGEDRRSAYLGLGSTLRCLGQYERSAAVFQNALQEFSGDRALKVFQALTHYNLGQHATAMATLIELLVETTSDQDIKAYRRALMFYADKLDQTWS